MAISDHLEVGELINLYHSGADAYMEKPIDTHICAAQAKALIDLYFRIDEESRRRATLAFGSSLVISPSYRQVFINGKQIELTRKQFDLLLYLARHHHQVFSAKQLYEQLWNDFFDLGGDNTVTVHINILRKKWDRWDQRSSRLCGALATSLSRPLNPSHDVCNEWSAMAALHSFPFLF